jgi:hypothetical protein
VVVKTGMGPLELREAAPLPHTCAQRRIRTSLALLSVRAATLSQSTLPTIDMVAGCTRNTQLLLDVVGLTHAGDCAAGGYQHPAKTTRHNYHLPHISKPQPT